MTLHYTNTTRYDYSGRKRKKPKAAGEVYQKYQKPRSGLAAMPTYSHRSSDTFYPSACDKPHVASRAVDNTYKIEASKNYTVAPAYNKGAYQVISKENIEHIGK